jgi:hypothetical protein
VSDLRMWACSLALCVGAARVEAQVAGTSEPDTRGRAAKSALHSRVRTGMTCRQAGDGSTVCNYTVGRSLAQPDEATLLRVVTGGVELPEQQA